MPEDTDFPNADRAIQYAEDMHLEGEPEEEFHAGTASRIPTKSAAGGALIHDTRGQILFVTPIYKPYLEIPGGIVGDNEPPRTACQREVREELGIDITLGQLLVVDWVPRQGIWRDSLQFIFDGGTISDDQIAALSLPPDELSSYKFASLNDVANQLKPSLLRRLQQAVAARRDGLPTYTEFGRP